MSAEQFANLAETTLASGYTAGGSTLTVASAYLFPTAGPFRVRLGNTAKTIWRVDSVSGTTFTGGAEANDGNASNGDTVKVTTSKAVAERFIQSPSAGEIAGYSGAAGADRYGPIWPMTPLDQSAWSWVNQVSGSTVTQANGVVGFTVGYGGGGENWALRVKNAPGTPWTVTAILKLLALEENFHLMGIGMRQSTSGKFLMAGYQTGATSTRFDVRKQNSVTSFSSEPMIRAMSPLSPLHVRMKDDGTNIKVDYSADGVNWLNVLSETRGTFFTLSGGVTGPDQVGLIGESYNSTFTPILSVLSWIES